MSPEKEESVTTGPKARDADPRKPLHIPGGESRGGIYAAMASIMKKCEAIAKGQRNEAQRYNFRGIDDIYNELHTIMAEEEVVTLPRVLSTRYSEHQTKSGTASFRVMLEMEYTFLHSDGSHVSVTVMGEGVDSGDKATNKASSGCHKYALLQTFLIPTAEDKDSEKDNHELRGKGQQSQGGKASQPQGKPATKPSPKQEGKPAAAKGGTPKAITEAQGKTLMDTAKQAGYEVKAFWAEVEKQYSVKKLGELNVVQWQAIMKPLKKKISEMPKQEKGEFDAAP